MRPDAAPWSGAASIMPAAPDGVRARSPQASLGRSSSRRPPSTRSTTARPTRPESSSGTSSSLATSSSHPTPDVAGAAGRASAKAAGVVVDDTAVAPRFVQGVNPKRELPIIKKITIGSLRNKLLFILPVALVAAVLANGGPRATTVTLRAARELWLALTVVAASWVAVYFITTDPTPWLMGKHTIFGEVADDASKKVVDEIANVKTGRMDRPVEDVVIESIDIA